jgi:hypothetical protein
MRTMLATLIVMILVTSPTRGYGADRHVATTGGQIDKTVLVEPMFGLAYSYAHDNVHYDLIPAYVARVCPYLSGPTFTYAHVKEGSAEYFVVMGPGPDVVGRGDSLGAALAIQGGHCTEWDSTRMFRATVPTQGYHGEKSCEPSMGPCHYVIHSRADEELIRALLREGLARGSRAWGSKRFRTKVCAPWQPEDIESNPIPYDEVTRFCGANR